tara:strand:+ start:969 stop:1808 length:840 start_codon:yes stop_codon:yes gene_type:complete
MKDFYIRSLTAVAYASFLIFPLFFNDILFYITGFICSLILVFEFIKLVSNYNHKFFSSDTGKSNLILYITFPLYISLFILTYNWTFQIFFVTSISITNVLLGSSLLQKKEFSFSILKNRFLGHFYLVGSLVILFSIPTISDEYNPYYVFYFLILMWVSDSSAYIFGINFGKRPLLKSVSPKKSIEGFVGGLMMSIIFSILLYEVDDLNLSLIQWVLMGILISSTGAIGDLVQSQFKREAGVKDSGNWLPGHGGLYDRMDSIIFASPFVYLILKYYLFVS